MPGSPDTNVTRPRPAAASARCPRSVPSSRSRPKHGTAWPTAVGAGGRPTLTASRRCSAGSWTRIAASRRRTSGPGSTPSSSASTRAQPSAGLQRLRLPPVAVERDHELGPPPLPQRLRGDQRLALRDGLVVTARGQDRGDPLLRDRLAQLVEPGRLRARERTVRELASAGPRQSASASSNRATAAACSPRSASRRPSATSDTRRRRIGGEPLQHVAGWARDDRTVLTALEAPAQPQHVVLQRLRRRPRRRVRPQRVDEPVFGNDRARVQGEHGEQAALLRPAQLHLAAGSDHADRPEDPNQRPHHDSITTARNGVQAVPPRTEALRLRVNPRFPRGTPEFAPARAQSLLSGR